MSRINDLLRQLETSNPALAKDLRREVDALSDRRAFGLNFERHQPEVVELPGRKVRRGDKVHVLPERGKNPTKENEKLWQVVAIDRTGDSPTATLEPLDESQIEHDFIAGSSSGREERAAYRDAPETTAALEDLVVVAEFRDPIYPGLVSTGKVERGGDKPFHTVINAENYHALQTLLFTHRGQVDCIYIDPPYNTGNEGWIYNDRYVAEDDLYRHSKWLAFIERRLLLARELLKPTGVIIVAIGEDEHHRLRMLLEQIFNADNFIGNVVWQGNVKNDARFLGGGLDNMLIFAKDRDTLVGLDTRWRAPKEGLQDVLEAGASAWEKSGGDHQVASRLLSSWWGKNKEKYDPGLGDNVKVDIDGTVIRVSPVDWPGGGGPHYDVLHPTTGLPVKAPANGWRFSTPERMDEEIAGNRILFGPDHTSGIRAKVPLTERAVRSVPPTFRQDRRASAKHLERVFGEKRFPNPKDHEVLVRWLRIVASADATVLDFFGGSGTTAEAVMRLNAEDGGSRQAVLVTNNEASASDAKKLRKDGHRPGDPDWEAQGVYKYVAKPRIETVTTGIRPDGSTYSEGLDQNVEFFTLTYEAPLRVASNREFARLAPLLWMRAGSQGRRIDRVDAGWDVADNYGVLADLDHSEAFLKAVATAGDAVRIAYVVTDEERLFTTICRELPDHVEPVRLYESYLRNFEIESGRGAR